MSNVPTASQTVGPFFSIGLEQQYRADMLPHSPGEARFTIQGRVLDGDGRGVPDAVLEIWHPVFLAAGGNGEEHNFDVPTGLVRVPTDEHGQFRFTGLKPIGLKELDGSVHAPHFTVLVFMRGLLRHLVARLYFPDDPRNDADAALQQVPENRRKTLIAAPDEEKQDHLRWDIHLQGDQETVFFDT